LFILFRRRFQFSEVKVFEGAGIVVHEPNSSAPVYQAMKHPFGKTKVLIVAQYTLFHFNLELKVNIQSLWRS
jgi:hypothetical protein